MRDVAFTNDPLAAVPAFAEEAAPAATRHELLVVGVYRPVELVGRTVTPQA